ncbi:MAG: DNA polymerase IV [Acidimicrobiia bacterium]|nr:DNA polymerase IV [Acidimicrobiia bacterium]MYD41148.1 DNA polymerase IV [Acidimicrobiia bacterium]
MMVSASPFREPILHVDMDAFFVEAERRRDPSLRDRAVVVGGSGRRGVVASASYEARRFGVHSAMPMTRARALCPALVVVPADHSHYGEVSEEVFAVFASFTPRVEKLSVDEAFLDVSGLRYHYRGVTEVGSALRDRVRRQAGLRASVGIAVNKTLAKLASEEAKPDGMLRVRVEESLDFLHALPVGRLWGVGKSTGARLRSLGIRTVGDLAALAVEHLRPVVGNATADHLGQLARGIDDRPVVTDPLGVSLSVENTFEDDLGSRSEIDLKLREQAERLAVRLQTAQVWATTVSLKVRFRDFTTITRSHTRKAPTRLAIDLFHQVKELADRAGLHGRKVRLLGISAGGLRHAPGHPQLALEGEKRWESLEEEVFRLRRRFGFDAVLPARLGPSPSPDSSH